MIVIYIFMFLAIKHFLAHHVSKHKSKAYRQKCVNNYSEETKAIEKIFARILPPPSHTHTHTHTIIAWK